MVKEDYNIHERNSIQLLEKCARQSEGHLSACGDNLHPCVERSQAVGFVSDEFQPLPIIAFREQALKSQREITKRCDLHAGCRNTDPIDLDRIVKVALSIQNLWLFLLMLSAAGVRAN